MLSGLVAGCSPPTEMMTPVSAAAAPVFAEPEDDEPPAFILREGELVNVLRTVRPHATWKGQASESLGAREGELVLGAREGELVEVRRAASETTGFAFRGDLGPGLEAPTARWLCRRMKTERSDEKARECEGRLHRIALRSSRAVIAWEACHVGPCRVAISRGRALSAVTIDGLSELRAATVAGETVLLASTRYARPGDSGAELLVLRIGPSLTRALELYTERVLVDQSTSVHRYGAISVEPRGLRFVGTEERASLSGAAKDRSARPIDERYPWPARIDEGKRGEP